MFGIPQELAAVNPISLMRWRRKCWLLIAAMVALGSVVRAWQAYSSMVAVTIALAWFAALCCVEDRLVTLRPHPSWPGVLLGSSLLLWSQWRQEHIIQPQTVMLVLPLLQAVGLILLVNPPHRLLRWFEPLLAFSLVPLLWLPNKFLPESLLSLLTARLCQVLFLSFGVDAAVDGPKLMLYGGGVSVAGPCSGTAMIAQLMNVAAIFTLVFPFGTGRIRLAIAIASMAIAPVFAVAANTLRISLLALINVSTLPSKSWWFDFFHHGDGGLIFSALAVCVFAPIYFLIQDYCLFSRSSQR